MSAARNTLAYLILGTLLLIAERLPAAEAPPADFDGLVAAYKDDGLPLPPPDAPLVRYGGGPRWYLGFLLKPATADQRAVVLVGTEKDEAGRSLEIVDPKLVKAEEIEPQHWMTGDVSMMLATAIQCRNRGWDDLAKQLLTRSLTEDVDFNPYARSPHVDLPPKTLLAYVAWNHWRYEIARAGTDRVAIAKRIRALFAAEPRLNTKPNQSLLHSLEAALVPSTAKPGSVEWLIDDLVEFRGEPVSQHDGAGPASTYLKLSRLGFEAVPELIEHLGDDRLTRKVRGGFNNFSPRPDCVGDIVRDLLADLAGDDMGRFWLDRQKGPDEQKAEARAWWEKVKPGGEEAYAAAHALPADPKNEWPNETLLRILAGRYPNHLPDLYRTILEQRPAIQSWPVVKAIADSALSREQKLALFLSAAENANLEHRRAAFWELKSLDAQTFVKLLVKTLDALPATPAGSYWHCREASLANLVMETDDPQAWAALTRAASRADVGLRMEMMNPMNYTYIGDRQRRLRVSFLAGFLDDPAVRDLASDPARFDGPSAGFNFPRLSVRDFAAMQIISILGPATQPRPHEDWTADQWSAERARAKAAADRESQVPASHPAK